MAWGVSGAAAKLLAPPKAAAPKAPKVTNPLGATFTQTGAATAPTVNKLAPVAAPAPAPAPAPQASPLDATYYANVAAHQAATNQSISQLQAQQGAAQTALQSALGQLTYQQPRDELSLMQGANNRGALYSSVYGQNLGDLDQSYVNKQTADQASYTSNFQDLANQIANAGTGETEYEAGQYGDAVARAVAAAQKNTALGQTPTAVGSAKSDAAAGQLASLLKSGFTKVAGTTQKGGLANTGTYVLAPKKGASLSTGPTKYYVWGTPATGYQIRAA